ncbi:hypothetical protein Vretimale_18441 [Volvox reticuliferus]|uniref:Uncharacterized protein n=1 Tax=Volvox reticuliferus TaxID=1737510 RepID=A0A8J4LZC1_9CHLO|nr:hypothetical protein Vretifemale_19837 [Volvox reticuliferus]GIM15691.1 hypothetical protein Vretimale_18441 [Volvox reticuliferus]
MPRVHLRRCMPAAHCCPCRISTLSSCRILRTSPSPLSASASAAISTQRGQYRLGGACSTQPRTPQQQRYIALRKPAARTPAGLRYCAAAHQDYMHRWQEFHGLRLPPCLREVLGASAYLAPTRLALWLMWLRRQCEMEEGGQQNGLSPDEGRQNSSGDSSRGLPFWRSYCSSLPKPAEITCQACFRSMRPSCCRSSTTCGSGPSPARTLPGCWTLPTGLSRRTGWEKQRPSKTVVA